MKSISIVLLGCNGVGKSSIIYRLVMNRYLDDVDYNPVIEDSFRTMLDVDDESYYVNILESIDDEEYQDLREQFIFRSNGILLVFSITSSLSFELLEEYFQSISKVNKETGIKKPIILVGNKYDSFKERVITREEGYILAKKFGSEYIEVSAKTGCNIKKAFCVLIQYIHKFEEEMELSLSLSSSKKEKPKKRNKNMKKKNNCKIQ
ncbi:P-loop containing nucleoside triphosphate hydrolase protein [Anaeromyces robustus]|uniref:p-loop containing nucleoside triphosphate hydrolase protein n=1 Tax=Anaeromyces robustus TaxID=1754192 RepID=A0A1Y1X049_9FUNG|nr:P-loop containing nucleoside triphosphate hydrolase protein [Anaeromyces robustus]|eukprot:ORX79191.1 P-loop containing nucleoside triphosphate hydrolase protein [Anaeromyces robustus]